MKEEKYGLKKAKCVLKCLLSINIFVVGEMQIADSGYGCQSVQEVDHLLLSIQNKFTLMTTNTLMALNWQLLKLKKCQIYTFFSMIAMFVSHHILSMDFSVHFFTFFPILTVTPLNWIAGLALWKCHKENLLQHLGLHANSRRQGQILIQFPLHIQPVRRQKTKALKPLNAGHHEVQCLRYFIIS